jgi:hypothetical protein
MARLTKGQPAPTPAAPQVQPPQDQPDDVVVVDLLASTGKSGPQVPILSPSPPFVLMHNPQRWDVLCGKLVPILDKVPVMPGMSGAKHVGKGPTLRTDATRMLERRTSRGWSVIPQTLDGGYVRKVRGTECYLTRWERTYPGSSHIDADVDGYVAWCVSLVDRGVVPEPTVGVLERLEALKRERLGQAADAARTNPSQERLRDQLAADLAVVREALGARRAGLTAAESDAVEVTL